MKPVPERDEPPPFLGRWSRVYAVVLLVLALDIALLMWLTWSAR